jgi:small-conductance mechanosensitive channel
MRTPAFLFIMAIALGQAAVVAETQVAPAASSVRAPAEGQPGGAPLTLGDRLVIRFHATIAGHGPAERAEGAARRLNASINRNPKVQFSIFPIEGGVQVLSDGVPAFAVIDGDVNTLGGDTPAEAAAIAIDRLRLVAAERAEMRDPHMLAVGAALAAGVTVVWVLLLLAVMTLDRRVRRWAEARLSDRVGRSGESSVRLLNQASVANFVRIVVHLLAWGIALVLSFVWLDAALRTLPFTRPWGDRLTEVLFGVMATIGRAALDALPGLLFVVVIVFITRLATQTAAAFFERVRAENLELGWLDRYTAQPTAMVVTGVAWLFAFAMAFPYLPGAQSEALQGLSVLLGLMISIGASSTVSQAASGLILMFSRAFRVGEYVRVGDDEGTVTEIGLVATRLRTGMGEEVLLPNALVLQSTSKNYSRAVKGTGFVLDTTVTIGYDAPWRQVHAMLVEAALRIPDIVPDPSPRVMQTALSDFFVEYRLMAYATATGPLRRAETLGELHAAIQDVFNEHGVQIMSPHYLGDPANAKVVPKSQWFARPAVPDAPEP